MKNLKAKTKSEMANELGMSRATFYRRIKEKKLELPKGLLSPKIQKEILKTLGWSSELT